MKDKNLKNNDFLVSLNIDHATDEEKIALLNRIIDNELEKPENEVDMALVDECMAFIADLDGDKFQKRDDELDDALKKITADNPEQPRTSVKGRFTDRKRLIKAVTGIAAALVLVFTSIIVITRIGEFSDLISTNTAGTVDSGQGKTPSSPTADYITFVKEDQADTYASIEELLQTERLDVMYPAALPHDVRIEKVVQTFYDDTRFELSFVFNSVSIEFTVTNCNLSDYEVSGDHEILNVNGHQFSFFVNADGTFRVTCVTDKYAYQLVCSDYNDLIDIISNLKELS